MAVNRELFDERHEAVMDGIKGIHARLDQLNGRTRTLETKVAVLQWAYGIGGMFLTMFVGYFIKG
jgi:hypothetical protein